MTVHTFKLPSCTDEDETKVFCKFSNLAQLPFEPVGRWFEACLKRQRSEKSVSIIEEAVSQLDENDNNEESDWTEDDRSFLLSLDAKEWKKQDHYRVLGLEKLRFDATEDDIKKAYRKKVLRYHPDKKSNNVKQILPLEINIHEYFTCITRAYEVLSCVEKRQAYDSVDEQFSDEIPSYNSKQNFFETFSKTVTLNARWSSHQPAPLLGDMNTNIDDVNAFYSFWYDFHSWRNFSNLDKEDTDNAESREERRWMEQENKKMRQKRKKEEVQRIRKLVDTLFQNDPRLKRFKEEKRLRKLVKQKAKENAEIEKEKQRQLVLEEERKEKERIEQEAKEKAQKEKKEKDRLKKSAARDRKIVRQTVKNEDYFDIDADKVAAMERLDRAVENLTIQELQQLREAAEKEDKSEFKKSYERESTKILEKLKKETEEKIKQEEAAIAISSKQSSSSGTITESTWSEMEKQLLVKASTSFPVGTASRYEVIANYINEHSGAAKPKTTKQVISKVKNLKRIDPCQKAEINKFAFQTLEKTTKTKSVTHINADPSVASPVEVEVPWSSDEQKLLEQALKTYPSTTPERWEKISSAVSSRTKKECMKRYKELVEMVKAKKIASQSVKK